MVAPSDHLLRTLAAVAPTSRVVDLGCAGGRHTEPLARLGFEVWACDPDPAAVDASRARLAALLGREEAERRVTVARPSALGYPDAFADWGVLTTLPDGPDDRAAAFAEAARVLKPGAWLWVETVEAEGLVASAQDAGLVLAEAPRADEEHGPTHVIFRRPAAIG